MARLILNPRRLLAFLCRWLPTVRLPKIVYLTKYLPLPALPCWVLVTRCEDVEEVISRNDVFNVAWSEEIRVLNDGRRDGTNFILGLDGNREGEGGEAYDSQLQEVMQAFRIEDVAERVVPIARREAEEIVAYSEGALDAIQQLITAVPLAICQDYYGVDIPRPGEFAQWMIAMSGYLFGPPFDRPRTHSATLAAADLSRDVINASIARRIDEAEHDPGSTPATVLARLARVHVADPNRMPEALMRSIMMGMITGFVPTNTVAGGHILEMLLQRPDYLTAAREAAKTGDDELLSRTLFEAMRFMPLNPGPWRQCARDCTIAAGTWRATRVRRGMYVLASTQSAMFDPRQVRDPERFDPARSASDSMLFGRGLHWCVGIHIAKAQIVQTLKPLVLRPNLERAPGGAGELKLLGLFPEHLHVTFDA